MSEPDGPSPGWTEAVRVRAGEAGRGGHLRLPSLCDWLQEAAGNNATDLGWGTADLLPRGLTWVLSRLHLRVEALPSWRDEATVRTWPSGAHRLWALREFVVTGASDRPLAVATSGWLLLKLSSKRPARPTTEIASLAAAAPPRTIADDFEEIPLPGASGERTEGAGTRPIGRFDLDLNGHANNVSLLRILLEAATPEMLEPPLSLEADFRAEAFEGDLLRSARSSPAGGPSGRRTELLSLVREADGREVLRGRVVRC